jgi:predicted amidohydrolase
MTLRMAVAQPRMQWRTADNLATIKWALLRAQGEGAVLCSFPELALTGFHRGIVQEADPSVVQPALAQVQALCARLRIAAALGAPTWADEGGRFNSHLLINEHGELAAIVAKKGLTDPEATFFQRGHTRPVARLQGWRCSAVICREVEDQVDIAVQLPLGTADLLFWPGQMRPDPGKPLSDPPEHVQHAQAIARAAGAYVVQSNWPNALNRPEESRHCGHSAVITPAGELLFRLPEEGCGLAVFDLGARHFTWLDECTRPPQDTTAA